MWPEIEKRFNEAVGLDPPDRARFLDKVCHGNEELRRELESLLAQTNKDGLLGNPALKAAVPMVTEIRSGSPGVGLQLGPYRIEAPLGAGGMGEVYRAVDTRLGRKVAIKIATEQFSKRFEHEARAISALNHPHICTLYDIGLLPSGTTYIVTELVEGETLRDWIKRLPAVECKVEIARQVLQALRAAHGASIVHRDLKPANIMVRFDGYVKVLDFGLAKWMTAKRPLETGTAAADVSVSGQIVGTFAYMSPEQILGQEVDQRSDLF